MQDLKTLMARAQALMDMGKSKLEVYQELKSHAPEGTVLGMQFKHKLFLTVHPIAKQALQLRNRVLLGIIALMNGVSLLSFWQIRVEFMQKTGVTDGVFMASLGIAASVVAVLLYYLAQYSRRAYMVVLVLTVMALAQAVVQAVSGIQAAWLTIPVHAAVMWLTYTLLRRSIQIGMGGGDQVVRAM